MKKRLLAVGDSTEIEIVYSTGKHAGIFTKTPQLYTSDPSVTESRLMIRGRTVADNDTTVIPLVTFDPARVEGFMTDPKDVYKVKMKNVSNRNLIPTLVSTHLQYMDVNLPSGEIKPGKVKEISVKLKNLKDYADEGLIKSFTIEFSDSAKTRYTIPVSYMKEKIAPLAGGPASANPAASQNVKPTNLKTKTGNPIDQVEAGTGKKK